MADEVKEEQEIEMNDDELAVLANKEIRKRDDEIRKLKLELNKAKLLSTAEEEKESDVTIDDCRKAIFDSHINAYDYASAVVSLIELEEADGKENPYGKDTDDLKQLFKNVIDACEGDKSKFIPLYQASVAPDDKQVSAAYGKKK